MIIKILGSGCPNCKRLEANTREALKQLGMEAQIIKITEWPQIMEYKIMATPALVVDEKIAAYGQVLSVNEVKEILTGKND